MGRSFNARTISITIHRGWQEVYEFLRVPENFAHWASGLGTSLRRAGDGWLVDGPAGEAKVQFTPPNAYGVLDHSVRTDLDERVYVPMRVIANGTGAEVLLTLFRTPEMTHETFERDAATVKRDLAALKELLESESE